MYYNKDGKKIEIMEWCELLENFNYKIIKRETLPNGKWISTVWIGLDSSFNGKKPLIFETMVFSKKGEWEELACERYSTLEEAEIGHEKMVKKFNK